MDGWTRRAHNAFVICIYANLQKCVVKTPLLLQPPKHLQKTLVDVLGVKERKKQHFEQQQLRW